MLLLLMIGNFFTTAILTLTCLHILNYSPEPAFKKAALTQGEFFYANICQNDIRRYAMFIRS